MLIKIYNKKELKRSLGTGMVVQAFNPITQEIEAGRSEFKVSWVYRASSMTAKLGQ